MKIMKLMLAAAIAFGTMSAPVAPAAAEGRNEVRHDDQRRDARRDDNRRHRGWNNNRGRHRGWHNNRGRHRGWSTRRVCRSVWRHHQRQRVCRTVRYRR